MRSNPLLDQAAVEAVRSWEFDSSTTYGATVGQTQTVAMHFTLR